MTASRIVNVRNLEVEIARNFVRCSIPLEENKCAVFKELGDFRFYSTKFFPKPYEVGFVPHLEEKINIVLDLLKTLSRAKPHNFNQHLEYVAKVNSDIQHVDIEWQCKLDLTYVDIIDLIKLIS